MVMNIEKLIQISRPHFWIYTLGPFLLGISSSLLTIEWSTPLIITTICFGLYFLFPANLLIYGVNDIYDYETDSLNTKKSEYEAVLQKSDHRSLVKQIVFYTIPLALLAIYYISNLALIVCVLGFLLVSVFYSTPPIRAKSIPFVDTLFNSIYVFPALIGYFLLHPNGSGFQPTLALAGLLWSMAMHAYSAVPDISADKKTGISTIATFLGFKNTLIFCYICYAIATFLTLEYLKSFALLAFVVYSYLIFITLKGGSKHIFSYYKLFPKINFIVGMVLFFVVFLTLAS
jgi:lycopene elongase/hydratase (dihydrobisanhydrobacterioruberin-forming)